MNLPNKLTVLRFILVIPFAALLLLAHGNQTMRILALVIFCIASLTDALDGYIARRDHLITDFGKLMDPLADKILVCTALIALVALQELPAVVCIVIIAREFIISGFRLLAADNGLVIAASIWGKLKTISQMVMIILLLAAIPHPMFTVLTQVFIWLSCLLTIISLIDYVYQNRSVLSDSK